VRPVATRTDLGRVEIRAGRASTMELVIEMEDPPIPVEAVRSALPPEARPHWARIWELDKAIKASVVREHKLERRGFDCQRTHCPRQACIDKLLEETVTRQAADKEEQHRTELALANTTRSSPLAAAQLAYGWLLVRESRDLQGDLPARVERLKDAIKSYAAAKANAGIDTDIGWFARWGLGGAWLEGGEPVPFANEMEALGEGPYRPRGTAAAWYRFAELQHSLTHAADEYGHAVEAAAKDPIDKNRGMGARVKLRRVQMELGRFGAAARTAADLLELFDGRYGVEMLEITQGYIGEALDSLGAPEAGLPALTADGYAVAASRVANDAEARGDTRAAAFARAELVTRAPDSRQARFWKSAPAPKARAQGKPDLIERTKSLVAMCRERSQDDFEIGEIEFVAEPMTEGRGRVTAKKKSGEYGIDGLVRCFTVAGPAFFVGVSSGAKATVVFAP